ncbi:hypothetical protein ACT4ML_19875 [Natrinema sp. LN54]|uniref:hypothetical protein n=1 Tax=Natrinema sp. LN54 TaxID=3458705 RepID=UPI004035A5CB
MSGKETGNTDDSFRRNIAGAIQAYKNIKRIPIFVAVGFIVAVFISIPAALLVAEVAQTHMQVFAIGACLAVIGMGSVLSQVLLNIEEGHHSIRPVPEWIVNTRLKFILLSASFAGLLTAGFLPVERPEAVWGNPVAGIFNTTTVVLAGALAPYMIKMITDFTYVDPGSIDKRLKQLMLVLPIFFFSLVMVIHRIVLPNEPTLSVVQYGVTSGVVLLGLLYTYLEEKPNDGWSVDVDSEVSDYRIVTELRKVGWRTLFLAILGWIGFILAAGTRSGAEMSFSSEIHIFPFLIAFRGVIGVIGAVLGVIITAVLVRVIVSVYVTADMR